jgi:hypothetical protein
MAKANPIVKELNAAAEGLLFPSETDAEIEAFAWPGGDGPPTEAVVRASAKVAKDTPVQQTTLAALTRTIPKESREDFQPLLDLLAKRLSGTTVFKVGEVNMDVYIVGRTADGQYAGVKTEVVET